MQLYFPRWGRTADELCVTELGSVIWAVQMSTVEFHPWNSRRADTEKPDEWRIDLDPGDECDYATVQRVAHVVHEVLDELGAVGFPKTSGGKGLHVYVRIHPEHGFKDVRRAALAFAREVERRAPDDVTTTWWRKDRDPRKLFVDYNQNARDHTIAAAYSVRGVPDARVSTPIDWDEVDDADPRDFTIFTVPDRFAELGDLHEAIDEHVFDIDRSSSGPSATRPTGPGDAGRAPRSLTETVRRRSLDVRLEAVEHALPVLAELLGLLLAVVAVLGELEVGAVAVGGERVDEGVVVLRLVRLAHHRAVVGDRQDARLVVGQHLALVLVGAAVVLAVPGDRAADLPGGRRPSSPACTSAICSGSVSAAHTRSGVAATSVSAVATYPAMSVSSSDLYDSLIQ